MSDRSSISPDFLGIITQKLPPPPQKFQILLNQTLLDYIMCVPLVWSVACWGQRCGSDPVVSIHTTCGVLSSKPPPFLHNSEGSQSKNDRNNKTNQNVSENSFVLSHTELKPRNSNSMQVT